MKIDVKCPKCGCKVLEDVEVVVIDDAIKIYLRDVNLELDELVDGVTHNPNLSHIQCPNCCYVEFVENSKPFDEKLTN